MPNDSSHSPSGAASAASPTMPLSTPIEVMPIWMVERKRVGSSPSFMAAMSAGIALIDQLLQPGLARGNQRQLGHGKKAIEKDEGEKYCYFHRQGVKAPSE